MVSAQTGSDLLRRPTRPRQIPDHDIPQPRPLLNPTRPDPPRRLISTLISTHRPIRTPAAIGTDLSPHRRTMPPNPAANHRIRLAAINPHPNLLTLTQRQHTPPALCLSSTHRPMIVDQTIHTPRTDPRNPRSLINRRPTSQRHQRLTHHTYRNPRPRHNPPP